MVRPPSFDSNGMKKGAWSKEEDDKLRAYVLKYGHWNWRLLPKYAGLARCGKSCRLRWVNYLKPGLKRGSFSKQEQLVIIQLHAQLGNKWSAIAAKLPGRTDNEIKNFWHTRVEKHGTRNSPSSLAAAASKKKPAEIKVHTDGVYPSEANNSYPIKQVQHSTLGSVDETKPASTLPSSPLDTNKPCLESSVTDKTNEEIWPDMFLPDTNYAPNDCFPQLEEDYHSFHSHDFQYSELSSSDTTYLSALDNWIGDDDHMSMSMVGSSDLWAGDSFATNASNSPHEITDDCLLHCFNQGVNLFGSDN